LRGEAFSKYDVYSGFENKIDSWLVSIQAFFETMPIRACNSKTPVAKNNLATLVLPHHLAQLERPVPTKLTQHGQQSDFSVFWLMGHNKTIKRASQKTRTSVGKIQV
jgi:hypothetical protein